MNEQYLRNLIEAALLAAGRPLGVEELLALFDERDRPERNEVERALAGLREDYRERGIELVRVASGYRIQVRRALAGEISRLWQERPQRYSRALLETLALIAYRQPVTRGEIEGVRGVQVNPNIVRTLLDRGWIRVVGHRDVPGHPELLATTREFLDYFGLRSLEELPSLAELREMDNVGLQLELQAPDAASADGGDAGHAVAFADAVENELAGGEDESGDDADPDADSGRPPSTGLVASGERPDNES